MTSNSGAHSHVEGPLIMMTFSPSACRVRDSSSPLSPRCSFHHGCLCTPLKESSTCAGIMSAKTGLWLVIVALCLGCLPFFCSAYCIRTGDLYTSTISQCYSYYNKLACCENYGSCTVYPAASVVTCPSSTRLPACCS